MQSITDSQALLWFCFASAMIYLLIFVPIRLANASKKHTDKKQKQVACFAASLTEQDTKLTREKSEELMGFLAIYFGISPSKLTPDANFIDDLRIPFGELDQFFEDIQEKFDIRIDQTKIHKVRDLLELLKLSDK